MTKFTGNDIINGQHWKQQKGHPQSICLITLAHTFQTNHPPKIDWLGSLKVMATPKSMSTDYLHYQSKGLLVFAGRTRQKYGILQISWTSRTQFSQLWIKVNWLLSGRDLQFVSTFNLSHHLIIKCLLVLFRTVFYRLNCVWIWGIIMLKNVCYEMLRSTCKGIIYPILGSYSF